MLPGVTTQLIITMKTRLASLLQQAISSLQANGGLPEELSVDVQIGHARDAAHGDFTCNVAMMLAKPAKKNPRQIAEAIICLLYTSDAADE